MSSFPLARRETSFRLPEVPEMLTRLIHTILGHSWAKFPLALTFENNRTWNVSFMKIYPGAKSIEFTNSTSHVRIHAVSSSFPLSV
jgi:hypothetical protein